MVINYGEEGLQNGMGGVKFYPYEKGEKVLAMLKGEGGGAKSFGVVFTW